MKRKFETHPFCDHEPLTLFAMNIGFDAKRAFHNGTGLGQYSRTLVQSLANGFPMHQYYLFNPKPGNRYQVSGGNQHEVLPQRPLHRLLSALWRSNWVKADLRRLQIQLYHGLSHELPVGIHRSGIPSVVTMHDLIHERYPHQYGFIDRNIYSRKFRYACSAASHVIAISQQTRQDLIDLYRVPPERITVCYQSCNPAFAHLVNDAERERVRQLYGLPPRFFLYVGSLIERKNLLNICKALQALSPQQRLPLVVIGNGGRYKQLVKDHLRQQRMEGDVLWLSEQTAAQQSIGFISGADFPAIYQCATALVYPSFFEGFGIPVLEALWSQVPVITSNLSCMPETGGDGAWYVDPADPVSIAQAMLTVQEQPGQVAERVQKGLAHAQRFSPEACANAVMEVYRLLW
jgi:glycosyltransferase involved in cell wall biosynthesis